jgi:HK97 gp10 family phage protein
MATSVGGVKLDTAVLDKITAELKPKAREIIETYGTLMAGDAAKGAPVETGALRSSITSESHMESDLTYVVQDGVEYGVFQELGTSKMAAQPFMVPSIEKWREKFYKAFEGLFP